MIHLVAGTYAGRGGGGLTPLAYDPAAGRLTAEPADGTVRNASAGLRLSQGRWALVDEDASRLLVGDPGEGRWREALSLASGGNGPCHLATDPQRRVLAVANYGDGTFALFRIDATTGLPAEPPARHRGAGHGPDAKRQEGPHAHWVGFDPAGTRLYGVDLGLDRVLLFETAGAGTLAAREAYVAPPGSGPRQLAFHPTLPVAYLVSELASTLTVLEIGADGTMTARRIVSTLPAGAGPGSYGGAIAIDRAGTRVYVSNRGHDSIAAFSIDGRGDIGLLDITPSGGSSPRFLLLLEEERRLMIAHEKADGVTVLAVTRGGLEPTAAHADVPGACFLARLGGPA